MTHTFSTKVPWFESFENTCLFYYSNYGVSSVVIFRHFH